MGGLLGRRLCVAAAIGLAGAGLAAASGGLARAATPQEGQGTTAQGVPGVAPPRGPQFIYDRTCGYCHGHNVGPIILGRNLPPQLIESFVRHGNGAMPAFKPTEITDAELAALARWISTADQDETEHGQ